jgi:hypothetical protein
MDSLIIIGPRPFKWVPPKCLINPKSNLSRRLPPSPLPSLSQHPADQTLTCDPCVRV